ncbi:MAG: hypothetical protein FJ398_26960 [Verrucomicrobia bacterium]|nr:hypothetical protein [Verrucomicrobiota bacterium]
MGTSREPDGRASLSPASRVGRVPGTWSGSPGRTRPTKFMGLRFLKDPRRTMLGVDQSRLPSCSPVWL